MSNADRKIGPNVKRLIIHKMSRDAVPAGGGLKSALEFIRSPERIRDGARDATAWVFDAIDAVKAAPGGKAYGDDEAIAAEILNRIDKIKSQRSQEA